MVRNQTNMFTLSIETKNEAFNIHKGMELARLLREVASKVERGLEFGTINDSNGNRVGFWAVND